MADSAHSCGPNFDSITPTVAAPNAAIAFDLASASFVGSFRICLSRIEPNDGNAAIAAGPNHATACPAKATAGASGPVSGAAAVIPMPSARAPSIPPIDPAALPVASVTVVSGLSATSANPCTAVGFASTTDCPYRFTALSSSTPGMKSDAAWPAPLMVAPMACLAEATNPPTSFGFGNAYPR